MGKTRNSFSMEPVLFTTVRMPKIITLYDDGNQFSVILKLTRVFVEEDVAYQVLVRELGRVESEVRNVSDCGKSDWYNNIAGQQLA